MFLPYLPWLYRLLLSFIFPDCVRVDMKILSCIALETTTSIWSSSRDLTIHATGDWCGSDNDMKAGAFLVASCMHQGRLERTAGVEPVSVLVACECGECSSMHGRRWQARVQLGPCVQGGCMRYLVYIYQCTSFFTATSATYTCHENVSCISP